MPVEILEHDAIRGASLERTRDFYRDVFACRERHGGPRLPRCGPREATRARLRRHGLSVGENEGPGARTRQILAPDPDGIQIELNFRNSPA